MSNDSRKGMGTKLRSLAAQWPLLAALAVLVAFGALYVERKLAAPAPEPVKEARVAPTETAPPAPPAPAEPAPDAGTEAPVESLSSQMVEVAARPVVILKGQAKWDDAAKTLGDAAGKVSAAAEKAGLKLNGRPFTVFTETDDSGFHFEAMAPIEKAPEGKPKLSEGSEIGSSPAGKALKFQHRGAYDEIDATYEAITAYLDEKGLDTKNLFIEEYLTDLKAGDDTNGEVDIYVFVK